MTIILIPLIIIVITGFVFAFAWGYNHSASKQHEAQIQNIKDYLDHSIPNEWTAYKKGVDEGYDQGLRDGQETHE